MTKNGASTNTNPPHFRGWEPVGSELTNNKPDYREQYDFGVDREAVANPDPIYMNLIGPNQWPDEALLPGFKQSILTYFSQMEGLAREILALFSMSLGLAEDHLGNVFGRQTTPYAKLLRYPPTPAGSDGVGAHKDGGFLTLLLQDRVGGLQAQNSSGEWVDVTPIQDTFVVNIGEMLQFMTGNYFIATPHRVVNKVSQRVRYSAPFFYAPDLNTHIKPLPLPAKFAQAVAASPRHASAGLMTSRVEMQSGQESADRSAAEIVFGNRAWEKWCRSHPENVKRFYAKQV